MCKIYKSKNGTDFSLLITVNCSMNFTYVDTDVEKDTTYYYKANVEGEKVFSDVVKAKTSSQNSNVDNNEQYESSDTVEPSETGVYSPLLIIRYVV